MQPTSTSESAWLVVRRDLGAVLDVWRRAPQLPACSLVLNLGYVVTDYGIAGDSATAGLLLQLASLALSLFLIGYAGTERLWYKRVWTGSNLSPSQVWRASLGYLPRFFGVGFVGGIALLPFLGIDLIMGRALRHSTFPIATTVGVAVLDMLATFITPAIAFTTRSGDRGIPLGLRLLRRAWPSGAVYVLVPPLALLTLARIGLPGTGLAASVGFIVLTTLFALAAKGATASFYLRLNIEPEPGVEPV